MRRSAIARFVTASILALLLALVSGRGVFAQGCAMCYNSAAAAGKQGTHALNQAILVLLIPPLAIFLGIFAFFYRRRNAQRVEDSELAGVPS